MSVTNDLFKTLTRRYGRHLLPHLQRRRNRQRNSHGLPVRPPVTPTCPSICPNRFKKEETAEVATVRCDCPSRSFSRPMRFRRSCPTASYTLSVPVWTQPAAIQDTPEVRAAELFFFRTFNEAVAPSG